jgi:hypothetical protein
MMFRKTTPSSQSLCGLVTLLLQGGDSESCLAPGPGLVASSTTADYSVRQALHKALTLMRETQAGFCHYTNLAQP